MTTALYIYGVVAFLTGLYHTYIYFTKGEYSKEYALMRTDWKLVSLIISIILFTITAPLIWYELIKHIRKEVKS